MTNDKVTGPSETGVHDRDLTANVLASTEGTRAPDINEMGQSLDAPVDHTSGALNQNNAGQGYAADNNFEGDAFRASAGMGIHADTNLAPTRDMYSGTTSIGAVDENADTAVVGGLGTNSTPGVRSDTALPGTQSGGVPEDLRRAATPFEHAQDPLAGDRMTEKRGSIEFNDPALREGENAAHNAGSGTNGAVHGAVGDVTQPGGPAPDDRTIAEVVANL